MSSQMTSTLDESAFRRGLRRGAQSNRVLPKWFPRLSCRNFKRLMIGVSILTILGVIIAAAKGGFGSKETENKESKTIQVVNQTASTSVTVGVCTTVLALVIMGAPGLVRPVSIYLSFVYLIHSDGSKWSIKTRKLLPNTRIAIKSRKIVDF